MSIRFEIENVSGYDSDYHHDAVMVELEMNNPQSFADEMLNAVSKLIQLPATWIDNADAEYHLDWHHDKCDAYPECDFDEEGNASDCDCFAYEELTWVDLHTNLIVLDGYEIEIRINMHRSNADAVVTAELRYGSVYREVAIEDETVDSINEHYSEQFEMYR